MPTLAMGQDSQPETVSEWSMASFPDAAATTVLLSLNPRAGSRSRHRQIEEIRVALEAGGFRVETATELGRLAELAVALQHSGDLRAVLAIGGDGTASVVRNAVPLEIPLVHVPMGTENLLGRYLGQKASAAAVCETVRDGVIVSLDLGRVGDRYFLLMISAGFDAEVIRLLHENRRGNIRRIIYYRHALRAILGYTYPQMRLYLGADESPPQLCRWFFAFNFPVYALGLTVAADAVATDGLLNVCTFERGSWWSVARYLWHVWRESHVNLADTARCRLRSFRLESTTSTSVAYQIDGEFGGTLPVDVEVLPGRLRLLVPPESAVRLGFRLPT